jgi:hypothetical protein
MRPPPLIPAGSLRIERHRRATQVTMSFERPMCGTRVTPAFDDDARLLVPGSKRAHRSGLTAARHIESRADLDFTLLGVLKPRLACFT